MMLATQAKLYLNTPRIIQPETWTLLEFDTAIRNDLDMVQDLTFVVPPKNADFYWSRLVRWENFEIPLDDLRKRQFMARFIRHATSDDTGTSNEIDTPGRDWVMATWPFYGYAGKPVGVEVWHDHSDEATVGHAQFVATTWDY